MTESGDLEQKSVWGQDYDPYRTAAQERETSLQLLGILLGVFWLIITVITIIAWLMPVPPTAGITLPTAAPVVAQPAKIDQELSLDLNSATAAQLEKLPGIGPVLAARICAYREEQGSFETKEAIMAVKGIGKATYQEIQEFIRVK